MAPHCKLCPHMYTLLRGLGELRLNAPQLPVSDSTLEWQSHVRSTAVGVLKPSPPYETPSGCG